jgi:serine/threonine-protein kinase
MLDHGTTGIVYEGYDPEVERRVAIKTLHPHLLKGRVGASLLRRFKREAISAARCLHPNIVTMLEYGQHRELPFIVMEYVDGISVQQFIELRRRHKRGIGLKRSLGIISGVLGALHAAHQLDIVHRDVKASNVLITRGSGQVKLADFGMARISEDSDLTMIGSMIGTPRYMAPELRFGLEADARADLFSATRLFLELLKMVPGDSKIPRSALPMIAGMPPGNLVDYSALYPSALIPVLLKGLEPDRERRYQSASELMQSIRQALAHLRQPAATDPAALADPGARPADEPAASEAELESMTKLLAEFTGPIAAVIMRAHDTRGKPVSELALEISRRIPAPHKRGEFLRRWHGISESGKVSSDGKGAKVFPQKSRPHPLLAAVLGKISVEVAQLVKPISKTFSRQDSKKPPKAG